MKKLFFILSLFFCGIVNSQIYTPQIPTSYGQNFLRIKPFQVLHIPTSSDTSLNTNDTSAQIRIISGVPMYHYSGLWHPFGTGGSYGTLQQVTTNGATTTNTVTFGNGIQFGSGSFPTTGSGIWKSNNSPAFQADNGNRYYLDDSKSSGNIALMSDLAIYRLKGDSSINGGYYPYATNPKGYLTNANISNVARTGSYTDLINKPNGYTWDGEVFSTVYFNSSATLDRSGLHWTFKGTSPATLTLPSKISNINIYWIIKNIGTATLTISASGSDIIFSNSSTPVTSITLGIGESIMLAAAATGTTSEAWSELFRNTGGGQQYLNVDTCSTCGHGYFRLDSTKASLDSARLAVSFATRSDLATKKNSADSLHTVSTHYVTQGRMKDFVDSSIAAGGVGSMPLLVAYNDTDQVMTSSNTLLKFNIADVDTRSGLSLPNAYIIPEDGYYDIETHVVVKDNSPSDVFYAIGFKINSTINWPHSRWSVTNTAGHGTNPKNYTSLHYIYHLTTGQAIRVEFEISDNTYDTLTVERSELIIKKIQ